MKRRARNSGIGSDIDRDHEAGAGGQDQDGNAREDNAREDHGRNQPQQGNGPQPPDNDIGPSAVGDEWMSQLMLLMSYDRDPLASAPASEPTSETNYPISFHHGQFIPPMHRLLSASMSASNVGVGARAGAGFTSDVNRTSGVNGIDNRELLFPSFNRTQSCEGAPSRRCDPSAPTRDPQKASRHLEPNRSPKSSINDQRAHHHASSTNSFRREVAGTGVGTDISVTATKFAEAKPWMSSSSATPQHQQHSLQAESRPTHHDAAHHSSFVPSQLQHVASIEASHVTHTANPGGAIASTSASATAESQPHSATNTTINGSSNSRSTSGQGISGSSWFSECRTDRPTLITLTTFPFRISFANAAARRLVGDDVVGKCFFDIFVKEGADHERSGVLNSNMLLYPTLEGKFQGSDIVKIKNPITFASLSTMMGNTKAGVHTGSSGGSEFDDMTFCKIRVMPVQGEISLPMPSQKVKRMRGNRYFAVFLDVLDVPEDKLQTILYRRLP